LEENGLSLGEEASIFKESHTLGLVSAKQMQRCSLKASVGAWSHT